MKRWSLAVVATLTLSMGGLALSCGGTTPVEPAPPAPAPPPTKVGGAKATSNADFAQARDAFMKSHYEAWPTLASAIGVHPYDGRLPKVTDEALAAEHRRLDEAIASFEAMRPEGEAEQMDRAMILSQARRARFNMVELKLFERNPLAYVFPFFAGPNLLNYVVRDYAPAAERAESMVKVCEALGPNLEIAKQRLPESMPRTWIKVAMMMSKGMITFADGAPEALPGLDEAQQATLEKGMAKCKAALGDYATFLEGRMKTANDDFRLGEALYLKMLRDNEGLDVDVARLKKVADEDLARNLAALEAAAKKIDPKKSVKEVVALVTAEKPPKDGVIAEAEKQSAELRDFVVEKGLVTIPSDDAAEVAVTPPFMRFNFAFLNSTGPLEKKPLPSFYYISPPNPEWPEKKQREYIPSRHDLLFVTAHEVWPGHFLHSLHKKRSPSIASQAFCSYAMSEGWAHYVEEMMWDEGAAGDDPEVHVGQLKNALLRNVRFVVSLGYHTGDMTVDQATELFVEKGLQDEGNATQQAVRGTFDPGYLSYTLGKLMIMKLRDDWRAENPDASLKDFHDTFMRYQCNTLPAIRGFMLAEAGEAL